MIADLLSVVLAASEYFCGRLFLLIKKINKQISYTLNRKQESVQNVCWSDFALDFIWEGSFLDVVFWCVDFIAYMG